MDTIERLLLDDPTWLYVMFGGLLLVLAGVWYVRRSRRTALLLLVPVVLAGFVALCDYLVETDREHIERLVETMAEEYRQKRLDTVRQVLFDEYDGFGMNKTALLIMADLHLKQQTDPQVNVSDLRIDVVGRRATMNCVTVVRFNTPQFEGRDSLMWTVYWGKINGEWKIIRVEQPRRSLPGFSGEG